MCATLSVKWSTPQGESVSDYSYADGDVVRVTMRGIRSYSFSPTIEGNIISWECSLPTGSYGYEVLITRADGSTLRYAERSVVKIVETHDDVTPDCYEDIDISSVDLGSAIFLFAKGDDGASAYDVAVANGFVGTEEQWLETLKGGGGSADIVQETGDSLVKVMSQNAVTMELANEASARETEDNALSHKIDTTVGNINSILETI